MGASRSSRPRCFYEACGGANSDLNVKKFTSRYIAFLIIKGVGLLSFTTPDPRVYVDALIESDLSTPDFNGHPGGAFHKVIRWSFERQGLYQPAGAPTPVKQPGAAPEVDVYIEDAPAAQPRKGEYLPYLSVIDQSPAIWNRHAADGGHAHQAPVVGAPQFLYVRVSNRGLQAATDVKVQAFQATAANQSWPAGWTSLGAPLAVLGGVPIGGEVVVGPIAWTPASDHPRVLASVSADGDLSNLESLHGTIPLHRLVPTDNNIAVAQL